MIAAIATDRTDPSTLRHSTDIQLAESAMSAPYAGVKDELFYDDAVTRAAVLCSRIIRNHPLPDGNKRTGYLAMKYQLEIDGISWNVPDEDDAVDTVQALAAGTLSEPEFIDWVRSHTS